MLKELLADERFEQGSGFWLRTNPAGLLDQLDLAFPWHPVARSLPGLAALAERCGVAAQASWLDLPVRHVALSVGECRTAITLYVCGPVSGPQSSDRDHGRARTSALTYSKIDITMICRGGRAAGSSGRRHGCRGGGHG